MDILDPCILWKLDLDIHDICKFSILCRDYREKKQVSIWTQIILWDQLGPNQKWMNYEK